MRALNALRSIVPRFGRGGASKPTAEAAEMSFYDAVKSKASALNKISYHRNHYLYGVSSLIKNEGIRIAPDAMDNSIREIDSITAILKHDVASLLKQIAAVPPEEAENLFGAAETQRLLAAETRLRVSYFLNYLGFLRTALQENQIARSAVNYERIVDAFLLGTASERIAEHIAMYGQKLDQYQLQASFYCLFEPELQTCLDLIKEDAVLTKKVLKDLNKYTATYLLDVLVLNTKSRSIFCWSVPEYSGFTPVDDHVLVETNVLLKSRREFFDDSDKIMDVFVKDFKERRVEWYTERKSLRQLLYQGMGFFFLVSFLDMYITQM